MRTWLVLMRQWDQGAPWGVPIHPLALRVAGESSHPQCQGSSCLRPKIPISRVMHQAVS